MTPSEAGSALKTDEHELSRGPRIVTFDMSASYASVIDVAYPPKTDYETHRHEAAYLCFVADGAYREWVRDDEHEVKTGDHRLYVEGSEHAVTTGPDGARVLHVTDPLGEGWRGERSQDCAGVLWQISEEIVQHRTEAVDDATRLHLESLALALRPATRSTDPDWLAASVERLRANYHRPIRLEELAEEAGVHPSHFARSFKQHVGLTAGDYLRRTRVAAAVRRLEDGDAPISEVAYQTGFSDQSHMGRYFRRYLSTTPKAVAERGS